MADSLFCSDPFSDFDGVFGASSNELFLGDLNLWTSPPLDSAQAPVSGPVSDPAHQLCGAKRKRSDDDQEPDDLGLLHSFGLADCAPAPPSPLRAPSCTTTTASSNSSRPSFNDRLSASLSAASAAPSAPGPRAFDPRKNREHLRSFVNAFVAATATSSASPASPIALSTPISPMTPVAATSTPVSSPAKRLCPESRVPVRTSVPLQRPVQVAPQGLPAPHPMMPHQMPSPQQPPVEPLTPVFCPASSSVLPPLPPLSLACAVPQASALSAGTKPDLQLWELYNSHTAQLDALPFYPAPAGLTVPLYEYQHQGLCWMMARETSVVSTPGDSERQLPPPRSGLTQFDGAGDWQEGVLPNRRPYFFNPSANTFSLEMPPVEQAPVFPAGGILADEQGLGKTLQVIALILADIQLIGRSIPPATAFPKDPAPASVAAFARMPGLPRSSATLVICSAVSLNFWLSELKSKVAPGALSVYAYHRIRRDRPSAAVLASYDVVLTTHKTLIFETAHLHGEAGAVASPLEMVQWRRIVLDDAHVIRERNSQTNKSVLALRADSRWCVTGTPVHNSHDDIFSLLQFLRVEPYGQLSWWTHTIRWPLRRQDSRVLPRLRGILQAVFLRRTRAVACADAPLPPLTISMRKCQFSPEEAAFYSALADSSRLVLGSLSTAGTQSVSQSALIEMTLRLRQSCDHPYLALAAMAAAAQLHPESPLWAPAAALVDLPALLTAVDDLSVSASNAAPCRICAEQPELSSVTELPCGHRFCLPCLRSISDDIQALSCCPACSQSPIEPHTAQSSATPTTARTPAPVSSSAVTQSLLRSQWRTSAKVDALVCEVQALQASAPGSKCVVFSQWSAMLDIVAAALETAGISALLVTGRISCSDRSATINAFATGPVSVLLASAASIGSDRGILAASHVYLLDPWWHQSADEYAIARVHRVGQTQSVNVVRFVVEGTIEERLLAMHQCKTQLAPTPRRYMSPSDYKLLLES
eukprot:TRINITY_DN440_c0_g1_i1.p1 TRINITY_DN440_c0_g1~~TRINITY_DN440_c0_g1_i1.p1  ORF type:complete len:1010 (+),score=158.14 TRINITY_DN440_c0_g1_i1:69-3032(+)